MPPAAAPVIGKNSRPICRFSQPSDALLNRLFCGTPFRIEAEKAIQMTIFYADDDSDDCLLLRDALCKIDPSIRCIVASDGAEALRLLRDGTIRPHYIFLDVNMPGTDGKKCLVELKKDSRLKNIPVVMCSTISDHEEIRMLIGLGATHFIQKSSLGDMCSALRMFIGLAA